MSHTLSSELGVGMKKEVNKIQKGRTLNSLFENQMCSA